MKITKRQLKRIINEALTQSQRATAAYAAEHRRDHGQKGGWKYDPRSVEAAEIAVEKVGYPQGGMIEDEIHRYLETLSDITDDDLWRLADDALSVAGIMLDVGPDAL